MELSFVKSRQGELARTIENAIREYMTTTGVIPVVEVHSHESRSIDGSVEFIPVVRVYSVIPEVKQ